ncbi:D-alanyl-D-alanine carboxypeptidase family protein [Ornithinibacillus xuwenensis]|uniref:D-alanyl-D-alanine carboxypeptidase family protein n=1 Tax=Ornithinibacillus xuwenensis TaxID=3144668 RepID=A0ABU9XPN2_9BACI
MFNNKTIYSILIGSMLMFLTACNITNQDDDAINQSNPTDTDSQTEGNSQPDEDINTEEEQPEVDEAEELALPTIALQKGDSGEEVKLLQKALVQIGYPITESDSYNQELVWAITDVQLQNEELYVTGIYDEATRGFLEKALAETITISPGEGLTYQENQSLDEETVEIGNPYEVLALINKSHALPEDYVPSDLVVPDVRFPFVDDKPKKQMREVAAIALEEMFAASDLESLDLFAQSGYRSYERQNGLFAQYASTYGEEQANTFSAKPGESEHQSGLTMDVTSSHVNYSLVVEFGETEEGIWLAEHAAEYGFIIRYPKGKEDITGYQYEPWHLRYVGVTAAKEIMDRGITLEEYLDERITQ